MTSEYTKRLGKFNVSLDLIEQCPEVVKSVLSHMIVLKAETLYHTHTIEYVAMCDEFDVVPEGYVVPYYEIEINETADKRINIKHKIRIQENSDIRKLIVFPKEEIENGV